MSDDAVVRKSVEVPVSPSKAFDLFTDDIAAWYVRDEHTLMDAKRTKTIRFEPVVGGRLVEVYDLKTGEGLEHGVRHAARLVRTTRSEGSIGHG